MTTPTFPLLRSTLAAGLAAILFSLFGLIGFVATPAAAQSTGELVDVSDALLEDGWFVELGAEATVDEIAGAANRAARDGIGTVLLASEIDGNAVDFADNVLSDVAAAGGPISSVLVITPGQIGMSSDSLSDAEVDRALNAFRDAPDAVAGVDAVTDSLGGASAPADTGSDSGTSGGSTSTSSEPADIPWGPIAGVGALGVVGLGGASLYQRRKAEKAAEQNLEVARAEMHEQLSAIAQMVFDLNDRVTLNDDADTTLRFQEASVKYNDLKDKVDLIENGPDMAEFNDEVDQLRWQLDWVEAKLDGRPLPAEPVPNEPPIVPQTSDATSEKVRARRGTCFFDPDHRPGTVPATVDTGSESHDVLICRECSRRLENGETPEPRIVQVGRRQMPAARAPLGYGGIGLALPDLFRILTRNVGRPVDVDWRSWPAPRQQHRLPRPDRLPRRRAPRRSRGRGNQSRGRASGQRRR